MIIALTGTPGCGKTAVAHKLAEKGFTHIDLNKIISRHKLYSGWDRKRKCWIADINKINNYLRTHIKDAENNFVIDSHLSHLLSARLIDIVVVLRCEPCELEKRLKRKKWNKKKIEENCEAELIGLISFEARKIHKKVFEIDATNKKPKQIANLIAKLKQNL